MSPVDPRNNFRRPTRQVIRSSLTLFEVRRCRKNCLGPPSRLGLDPPFWPSFQVRGLVTINTETQHTIFFVVRRFLIFFITTLKASNLIQTRILRLSFCKKLSWHGPKTVWNNRQNWHLPDSSVCRGSVPAIARWSYESAIRIKWAVLPLSRHRASAQVIAFQKC